MTFSAQEIVDRLRLEMPESEVRDLFQVQPVIDEVVEDRPGITPNATLRRQLYSLPTKYITVMVLLDDRDLVRLVAVTSQDGALRFRYPSGTQGGDANVFHTGQTTLEDLTATYLHAYNGFGIGGPWGYLAVACGPNGANNFGTNIVAINMRGPGTDHPALRTGVDLDAVANGDRLDRSEATLTFNTLAWLDHEYIIGPPAGDGGFEEFVELFEMGPWRTDPVPPFIHPVSPAPEP